MFTNTEMSTTPENKICQNCKQNFTIEFEDFSFYEKIKVPPPTFCFECRVARRMAFRNERVLYKRKCEAPGHSEELISIFSPENKQRVYDHAAWWGDSWDALTYGRDIDWNRPFLEQLGELWKEVPDIALMNINPVNSQYCSITEGNKNCYLVFGGDFNENTLYSTYVFECKETMDSYWVQKSEYNYETVDCISCSRLLYSRYCESSYDSAFLFNCRNCHDCFGCVNLVNKSYCIWNVQYSKEEYLQKLKELNLDSRKEVESIKEKFKKYITSFPRRFAKMVHTINSSGDNLENCKNCRHCFDVFGGGEDNAHVFLAYSLLKDSMDVDRVGKGTELCYDCSTVYPGHNVFFSRFIFDSHHIEYSYNVHNSSNMFGCVGLRNKQYCILNKQYTKEEYEILLPKLKEHMKTIVYKDKGGRVYPYGEFFPIEISPFAYNETLAYEIYPLSQKEVSDKHYEWREPETKTNQPTLRVVNIPDRISDVEDNILEEVLECAHGGECKDQCTKAFRITRAELQLYRQLKVPLPSLCPSCRHFARLRQRNPIKLWKRNCDCKGTKSSKDIYKNTTPHSHGETLCNNSFETTYDPERPEIVYCEACYNKEVY
jgi:hypothetical protein